MPRAPRARPPATSKQALEPPSSGALGAGPARPHRADAMLLFVGLGNPGREHAAQRHNIGFMAVDAIAARHRAPPFRARFQGLVGECTLGGDRVMLLKPRDLHERVRPLRRRGRALLQDHARATSWSFTTNSTLRRATVRVKTGGGNAGHNGLRSITAQIGNDYRRVRLGIGHPGIKDLVLGLRARPLRQERDVGASPLRRVAAEAADLVAADDPVPEQDASRSRADVTVACRPVAKGGLDKSAARPT